MLMFASACPDVLGVHLLNLADFRLSATKNVVFTLQPE